jgi:formiminotetrahydrofolate cyclodeaminase
MLANQSLTDVFDAFSSPAPTPGGGSAAALAGALGASLVAMVAALPKTKNNTPEEREALDAARTRILELRSQLVELIDRDAASYDAVVAAYRLPKATDADKAARQTAIQDALKLATNVPLETYLASTGVVKELGVVAEAGNPSARSDIAVAMQLLMTASQGALLNIEANAGSLSDQAFLDDVVRRVKDSNASSTAAMSRAGTSAGFVELFKQVAARFELGHGQPPPREVLVKGAIHGLKMMGSADARAALEALAASTDDETARQAREALSSST